MINVNKNFPKRTGDTERDLDMLFDYLYQFERDLRFELQKPQKAIKLSNGAEMRRFGNSIWIGTKKKAEELETGDDGLLVQLGKGIIPVSNGKKAIEYTLPSFETESVIRETSVGVRYYPLLNLGYIRLYGVINTALTAGNNYTFGRVDEQYAAAARCALSVFSSKQGCAYITADGEVIFKPYENINAGYAVYISGAYITKN